MKQFVRIEPTTIQEVGDKFKRQVAIKRFRTEDGLEHEFTTTGKEGQRCGAVIAVTAGKQVVVMYQFRGGPERWMYDIPGGGFGEDEDAQTAALRELKEETGYEPGQVEFLGTSSRDSLSNVTWYYYLATDCTLGQGARHDQEESDQGAEARLISIDELIENAKKDQMTDPHAVLMAYDRLTELKQRGAQ